MRYNGMHNVNDIILTHMWLLIECIWNEIDKQHFPMNTIDLQNPAVLIWHIRPIQQKARECSDRYTMGCHRKIKSAWNRSSLSCKGPDGKESFKVTARLRGGANKLSKKAALWDGSTWHTKGIGLTSFPNRFWWEQSQIRQTKAPWNWYLEGE